MAQHKFGGGWTNVKLEHVRKYLRAYTTIMNSFHFRFAYIDAFAGTGYRTLKESENATELTLPKMFEEEVQEFLMVPHGLRLRLPLISASTYLSRKTKLALASCSS